MGINFKRSRRAIRIFAPLLFLLLCLAVINAWPASQEQAQEPDILTAVSPTTRANQTVETAVPSTSTPIPTVTATATATPIPTATLPPDAEIRLLGPPADALFRTTDALVFYWQWPAPLAENYFFQVVLFTPSGENIVGQVTEANFGTQFSLQANVETLLGTELTGEWQVQILSSSGDVLRSSKPRNIQFLAQ